MVKLRKAVQEQEQELHHMIRRDNHSNMKNNTYVSHMASHDVLRRRWKTIVLLAFFVIAVYSFEVHISPGIENVYVAPEDEANGQKLEGKSSSSKFQRLCPRGVTDVKFLFPHVNKAGGRSLEATFDEAGLETKPSMRHITRKPRSK